MKQILKAVLTMMCVVLMTTACRTSSHRGETDAERGAPKGSKGRHCERAYSGLGAGLCGTGRQHRAHH